MTAPRRSKSAVRPRPRVYEPRLRAYDSNTSNLRETLAAPAKGKRLRILRVRVIQEVADGRRIYEIYFGDAPTISANPAKAIEPLSITLDIPEQGEAATRVFPIRPVRCPLRGRTGRKGGPARPRPGHGTQNPNRIHRGKLTPFSQCPAFKDFGPTGAHWQHLASALPPTGAHWQ